MKKSMISLLLCGLLSWGSAALWAENHPACPEKVLDRGTVEGVYQGTECGDMCHAEIKLDNGDIFYVLADPDEADKVFGKTGNRVSVTYEVQQYWNEFGGMCARDEVFREGRRITGKPSAKSKTFAPSFDCKKASTTVEHTICADPVLAELDVVMAARYKQALNATSNKEALRSRQREWLKQRGQCAKAADIFRCLQQRYRERLSQL